jgi:hypothetical protein
MDELWCHVNASDGILLETSTCQVLPFFSSYKVNVFHCFTELLNEFSVSFFNQAFLWMHTVDIGCHESRTPLSHLTPPTHQDRNL